MPFAIQSSTIPEAIGAGDAAGDNDFGAYTNELTLTGSGGSAVALATFGDGPELEQFRRWGAVAYGFNDVEVAPFDPAPETARRKAEAKKAAANHADALAESKALIRDAKQEAERIRHEARDQAVAMVEEAKAKAAVIIEEAKDEGTMLVEEAKNQAAAEAVAEVDKAVKEGTKIVEKARAEAAEIVEKAKQKAGK
jgi:F0F1-type ATP synthase membrane subunit b/b'